MKCTMYSEHPSFVELPRKQKKIVYYIHEQMKCPPESIQILCLLVNDMLVEYIVEFSNIYMYVYAVSVTIFSWISVTNILIKNVRYRKNW